MSRLQAEQQRLFPEGTGRAMVLELAGPGAWEALARVWQGVQADLQLPPPAIAVSGTDGYQLWFSFAQPVPAAQATTFLEGLRRRYLGEIEPARIRTSPSADGTHPVRLPPLQVEEGHWSAFVTEDLAAVFGSEPWLDLPPTPDAQAELLSRVHSAQPADLARALERLAPAAAPSPAPPAAATGRASEQDPRSFLLGVMNDGTVELGLRIEAANA
ncbi:MAG TPA: hypothetical protein VGD76_21285, partial [Ramlibacter sp.]